MRRPGGYAVITDPDAPVREIDTFTCGHCNRVVHVPPRCDPATLGGQCKMCMTLICPACAGKPGCDPFEKKLERMEARGRALRSYGFDV
jgi:hypothetical protein